MFVEGNVYGMYLFGYGNYVSSAGNLGFTVTKHLSLNAGTNWEAVWSSTTTAATIEWVFG